jgi:hypothetical protein
MLADRLAGRKRFRLYPVGAPRVGDRLRPEYGLEFFGGAATLIGMSLSVYALPLGEAARAKRRRLGRVKAIGSLVELLCIACGSLAIAVLLDSSGPIQLRVLDAVLTAGLIAAALIAVDHLGEAHDELAAEELTGQVQDLGNRYERLEELLKRGIAGTGCVWVALALVAPVLIEITFGSLRPTHGSMFAAEALTVLLAGGTVVGVLLTALGVRIGAMNRWAGQVRVCYGVAGATALLIAATLTWTAIDPRVAMTAKGLALLSTLALAIPVAALWRESVTLPDTRQAATIIDPLVLRYIKWRRGCLQQRLGLPPTQEGPSN